MFINDSTTEPKCNNEHFQNQLSSTNATNNNNNNNINNFHNNIHPGTIHIPFDQTMNLPTMTSSSIVLTPTSPNASTPFYHTTSSFQNSYLSKQSNNDIYQSQHHQQPHQHHHQQLSPTLDVLSTITNSLNIDKCIDNEYCDYMTTFIDTPNSIFSDETPTISTTTTTTPITPSSSNTTLLSNENQSYNSINTIKEDIFKFEPEYIERFQQNFQYQHNHQDNHPQQHQMLSVQANQSPAATTTTTEFDEINILNLDAEYFNYDEVNCQSKHHSPCTSPHIDPWLCLNLNNSIILNDTYKNTVNHENCSVSPKQNNNCNNYNNNNITPLPSITTTFTQQFQNDTYSYDMNFLDDYNNAEAQTPQFTQSQSSVFHQLTPLLTLPVSVPTSSEQNELACDQINIVIDQNKFVQLHENYNMIVVEKPNREHKNIWFNNMTNTNNSNQLLLISNENLNYDDNNFKENGDDDDNVGSDGGTDENQNENGDDNNNNNNNHNDDDHNCIGNDIDDNDKSVKEYSSKNLIDIKSVHDNSTKSNEKQYSLECQWIDCYQNFTNQSSLVSHIEKKHVEMRKGEEFSCFWLGCVRRNKPFNARYKLLIHMRVHSGEKPNKCPFNECNKAFSRLENLKIHQRSHTGERPYTCQYAGCLKAFSNSSDRAKHQRTHYDTKPYACQIEGCIKRYTDPSSLRKHVKNHNARDHHQQHTIQTTLQSTSRRKSHKDTINNNLQINGITTSLTTPKQRRRYSDSSTITTISSSTTAASSSSTTTTTITTDNINNIYYDNQSTILTPNSIQNDQFLYDDVFTNDIDNSNNNNNNNNDQNEKCNNPTKNHLNTMNFNEMTNCIVTIQNNNNNNHNDCISTINHHNNNDEQLFKTYNLVINNVNDNNHHESHNNENIHQTSVVDSHQQLTDDVDEFVSFECVKKFLGEQNMDYIDSAIQNQLDIDYFNEII